MVRLVFKTPSKEQSFELNIDINAVANVEQLKQKVAEQTNSTVPAIKLIHKGKTQSIQEKFSRMIPLSPRSISSMERTSTQSSRQQNPNRKLQNSQPPTPTHSRLLVQAWELDWEEWED